MKSTMMDLPLSTQMILRHGMRVHANSRVGTFDGAGFRFSSFSQVASRAVRLAAALRALGIARGERVASYCWNHQAHLEAYLAVPAMGAVLHTLNVRLLPEQIAAIMAHADDRALIIDASLWGQLRPALAALPGLKHVIVVGGDSAIGKDEAERSRFHVHDYDPLIAGASAQFAWPALDERDPAVVCYTSGTTGDPKGVVYSHRSIFLHTLGTLGHDTFGICQADRILLMPSMFHANAWGLPFSAWFAGSDLLLPAVHLKPEHLRTMIGLERPTFTAVVPTLINDLLQSDRSDPLDMSSFRVIVSGGSAVSPALIDAVRERWGVPVLQGWGMTETSPMCCLSIPPRGCAPAAEGEWRAMSGRPVPGMEVRIVDAAGKLLANDGVAVGELQLHGPWVTGSYHRQATPESFTTDGWLRTGDVGSIDAGGYVRITDRTKDVIKSGGEWVSSVELENAIARHPDVFEVAVIGIPDPRWEERPLALIVNRPGVSANPAELREFVRPHVARYAVPEYWSTVAELPRTSVGKIDKKELRRRFAAGEFDVATISGH
ncbi:MAG: long-chain-fatty-acid--CoA ligase [Steroidobacteraceae bacterium]